MKNFVFILSLLLNSFLFSQEIEWQETRKIEFSDFKGKPPAINNFAANSMISINYKVLSKSIWTGKIKIKIFATFDSEKSWVSLQYLNQNGLLEHEQIHFDIAEFFSRKLSKVLVEKVDSVEKFNRDFQILYDKVYQEYIDFQNLFEEETSFGTNIEKQKIWKKRVDNLLKITKNLNLKS